MRILVVEDAGFMAAAFKQLLVGHDVVCVSHFVELHPVLHAVKHDGTHVILQSKIDVAFVDGECGTDFGGAAIVQALVSRGVACMGISCDGEMNADMRAAGAKLALQKPYALVALFRKLVPLATLNSATAQLQQQLDEMSSDWRSGSPDRQAVQRIISENLQVGTIAAADRGGRQ